MYHRVGGDPGHGASALYGLRANEWARTVPVRCGLLRPQLTHDVAYARNG